MGTVKIVITAEDQSSTVFRDAERQLGSLANQAERSAKGYEVLGDAAGRVQSTLRSSVGIVSQVQLANIALETSTLSLASAQMNYTRAVRDYGEGSEEATRADLERERALRAVEAAQLRAKITAALVGAEVASLVIQAPKAIAGLRGIAAGFGAVATQGGIAAIATTGGIAAAGILAGVAAFELSMRGVADASHLAARGIQSTASATDSLGASLETASERAATLKTEIEDSFAELATADKRRAILEAQSEVSQRERESFEKRRALRTQEFALLQKEREQVLRSVQAAATVEKATRAAAFLDQFALEKGIQAAILTRDSRFLEDQKALVVSKRSELLRELSSVGADADVAGLERALTGTDRVINTLEGALGQVASANEQAAARAASAWDEAASSIVSKLGTSFGVQLSAFTDGFQAKVLAAARSVAELGGSEADLFGVVDEATRKLLLQGEVTARKDETTEQFRQRLLATGLSEAEFGQRVDETGRKLRGQADATRELRNETQATASAFQQLGGVTGLNDVTRQGLLRVASGAGFVDVFADELPNLLKNSGFARSVAVPGIAAANGFDGTVTKPTLFLAGEAGAEHVQVTPNGRGGTGSGPLIGSLTINVSGSTGGNVADQVAQGVRRGLDVPLARIAARRG